MVEGPGGGRCDSLASLLALVLMHSPRSSSTLPPPPHTHIPPQVMACPGGCIGGGGQPKTHDPEAVLKRMGAVYAIDGAHAVRKSHQNKAIQHLYEEFLGQPGGEVGGGGWREGRRTASWSVLGR